MYIFLSYSTTKLFMWPYAQYAELMVTETCFIPCVYDMTLKSENTFGT